MPDRLGESISISITAANGKKTNEITISKGQNLSYKHIWENVCDLHMNCEICSGLEVIISDKDYDAH